MFERLKFRKCHLGAWYTADGLWDTLPIHASFQHLKKDASLVFGEDWHGPGVPGPWVSLDVCLPGAHLMLVDLAPRVPGLSSVGFAPIPADQDMFSEKFSRMQEAIRTSAFRTVDQMKRAFPGGIVIDKSDPPASRPDPSDITARMAALRNSAARFFGPASRSAWVEAGEIMLQAVEVFPPVHFAQWLREHGAWFSVEQKAGDAMWCARFPERVVLVSREYNSPSIIREKWEGLFAQACEEAAFSWNDAFCNFPTDEGDDRARYAEADEWVDKQGEAVAKATAGDAEEAAERIWMFCWNCAKSGVSAAKQQSDRNRAIRASLRNTLCLAMTSGISPFAIARLASEVYGGEFEWDDC